MKILFAAPALDQLIESIEYFRSQPYTNDVHLDFNLEIVKTRYANAARYTGAHTPASVSKTDMEERLKSGFSLIDEANIFIDAGLTADLFDQLVNLMVRFDILAGSDGQTLVALRDKGSIDATALVRAGLVQNESFFTRLAEETDTDASLLAVIAENLARPVLTFHSAGFEAFVDVVGITRNTCPCCGNAPIMAVLDGEEGRRFLKCSLCHTRWEFSRIECPHCRHVEEKGARYLFYDDNDPHRVDVCDKCKRYVRTVDARKTQNRSLELEAETIATGYLDDMAMKRGYRQLPE